jgi:hypothetical protein
MDVQYKKRYVVKGQNRLGPISAVSICLLLLVLAGLGYRWLSVYLEEALSEPVVLDVSLSNFPVEVDGWVGRDVEISEEIQKVAGNDDFLNRLYSRKNDNVWANVYVAFSARPRTMLGHNPQFCYKGSGWISGEISESQIKTAGGAEVPYLLHRFKKDTSEIFVLNFYILNGQIINSEGGFSGIAFKSPNIKGSLARYVAQIQISSKYPSNAEQAATDLVDTILEFFPDEQGKVHSYKYLTSDKSDIY